MAAGTFTFYNNGLKDAVVDNLWGSTSKCAILVNGYTPSAAHDTYSDVSGSELAGGGDYAPVDLTTLGATDKGSGVVSLDATCPSFGDPVSIGPADYVIIVQSTVAGLSAGDKLVGYMELETGSDVTSISGEFTVNFGGVGDDEVATGS